MLQHVADVLTCASTKRNDSKTSSLVRVCDKMFPVRPEKMNECMKTRVISYSQLVTCQDHDMRTKRNVSETSLLVRDWGEHVN